MPFMSNHHVYEWILHGGSFFISILSALSDVCCSEAAAHAVATLAEATLQGGGQIVLAETAAAVGALAGTQDATGTYSSMTLPSTRERQRVLNVM